MSFTIFEDNLTKSGQIKLISIFNVNLHKPQVIQTINMSFPELSQNWDI